MKIKPAKRIVVLKPTTFEAQGISGQLVVSQEKPPEVGIVVEVGEPGKKGYPVKMAAGDIVAYRKYGDNTFTIKGEIYKFVIFDDILAVLDKEDHA